MTSRTDLQGAFQRVSEALAAGADLNSSAEVQAAWVGATVRVAAIAGRVADWLALADDGPYGQLTADLNGAADALPGAGDDDSILAALAMVVQALSSLEVLLAGAD